MSNIETNEIIEVKDLSNIDKRKQLYKIEYIRFINESETEQIVIYRHGILLDLIAKIDQYHHDFAFEYILVSAEMFNPKESEKE